MDPKTWPHFCDNGFCQVLTITTSRHIYFLFNNTFELMWFSLLLTGWLKIDAGAQNILRRLLCSFYFTFF